MACSLALASAALLCAGDLPPTAAQPRARTAIEAEVESLAVSDVAWRQIAWKTCLLEGLHASRAEHKPLLLWVFIDRPVDDERC